MKVLAITQARTGSTRLPNKVLKEVNNKSLLQIHLERLDRACKIDKIIVATTTNPADIAICKVAENQGFDFYRGSEDDVLDRYYKAALPYKPEYVIRVTSDCPLIDPGLIDELVDFILDSGASYVTNVLDERFFPDGQDIEIFKFSELESAWQNAELKSEREHVTPYIRKKLIEISPNKILNFNGLEEWGFIRMTVDEPADYELVKMLITKLGDNRNWKEYALFLKENKELTSINSQILRNEGYKKSIEKDNGNR